MVRDLVTLESGRLQIQHSDSVTGPECSRCFEGEVFVCNDTEHFVALDCFTKITALILNRVVAFYREITIPLDELFGCGLDVELRIEYGFRTDTR
jgi:hypothetical protein